MSTSTCPANTATTSHLLLPVTYKYDCTQRLQVVIFQGQSCAVIMAIFLDTTHLNMRSWKYIIHCTLLYKLIYRGRLYMCQYVYRQVHLRQQMFSHSPASDSESFCPLHVEFLSTHLCKMSETTLVHIAR